MSRLAGSIQLGIGPAVMPGFWSEVKTRLKKNVPEIDVKIGADTKKASSELAAWRKRQEANRINLRVDIDKSSIRQAEKTLQRIEHTYKQNDLRRAIRIQVVVAGAAALPALTQGALSATTALTELGRAALVLP